MSICCLWFSFLIIWLIFFYQAIIYESSTSKQHKSKWTNVDDYRWRTHATKYQLLSILSISMRVPIGVERINNCNGQVINFLQVAVTKWHDGQQFYNNFGITFIFLGTHGRKCNRTSTGLDSCSILCCGRGYNTKKIVIHERCNCKFQWCCNVRCDTCKKVIQEYTCK